MVFTITVPGLYLAGKLTVCRGIGDALRKLEKLAKLLMGFAMPDPGRTGPIGWRVSGSTCARAPATVPATTASVSNKVDTNDRIFTS